MAQERVQGQPARRLVVVVEDDDGLRAALGRLLHVAGYDTALFESAEGYLNAPPTDAPCLLLDINLPGMSGLHLRQHLRSTNGSAPPPIILTTADRSFERYADIFGGDALLVKPVSSEVLLATIESLTGRD